MAKLIILTTAYSISMIDSDKNRINVYRKDNSIELTSSVNDPKKNKAITRIQNHVKHIILNPRSTKDSWERRFNRIKKACIGAETFLVIANRLDREMAAKELEMA